MPLLHEFALVSIRVDASPSMVVTDRRRPFDRKQHEVRCIFSVDLSAKKPSTIDGTLPDG